MTRDAGAVSITARPNVRRPLRCALGPFIERLTAEGQFGELEQQARALRQRRASSAIGAWLQSQFFGALAQWFKKSITDEASWVAAGAVLTDLVTQPPQAG